jgi:hypothetical protein
MTKSIGMTQAKSKLAELVGRVAYGGEHFVLERRGPEGDTFWLELIEEMP